MTKKYNHHPDEDTHVAYVMSQRQIRTTALTRHRLRIRHVNTGIAGAVTRSILRYANDGHCGRIGLR